MPDTDTAVPEAASAIERVTATTVDPSSRTLPPTDPPRPLRHLTDDALEHRLAALAGHLAATQASFLAHVLELDMRGLWGRLGLRSAAHYLSWRLGLGLGTARQHVRVAYALLDLPTVAAAFAEGRLSYSKVRAITRVATPANEKELLEVALGCTGAQLEHTVRAFRKVLVAGSSASATLRRRVDRRVQDDGSVVFTIRVAPDDAAVLDRALDMALRVVLDDDGRPFEVPEETRLADELTDHPPIARAKADAFVLLAESFVANGSVGDRGDGLGVVLHPDLAALERLLGTERAAHFDGQVPQDIQDSLLPDASEPDPQVTRPPSVTGRPPTGTRSVDGQPLLTATAMRRICETSVRLMAHAPDGRPIDLGRTARDASPRQRRVLHERDGHCRFPGCTQRRRLIPHHVQWWSRGGLTDLDNLVLVCPTHHRAVHEVGYQVTAHGEGRFSFTTPDGIRLTATGQIVDPASDDAVVVDIRSPYHPLPTWGGERLDLRLLVDTMVANTLITSGHRLPDVPLSEMPRLLREATGWPRSPGWPRTAGAA